MEKCKAVKGFHGACDHDINQIVNGAKNRGEWTNCPQCNLPWKYHTVFKDFPNQSKENRPKILHPEI